MILTLTIGPTDLLEATRFLIPAYVANATPILLGGGKPIDLGKTFLDGERVFGSNKTVRGFIGGLIFGTIAAVITQLAAGSYAYPACILIPLGSLCGDLAGAFTKRRLKLKPGFPLPLLDQLDFIIGSLLLSYPALSLSLEAIFIILLITPPAHLMTNIAAYLLRVKENYW
ncbi:MAG: CDP-2,3-bis-(O-geranylgeranyl)-sn-glycerol synthase [Candidatus Bathyarchaeia archaeon]